ncbi:hypothetical protein Z043_105415 [Scleropages formosus]|uniref:Uncharacterized protein n=1 Tax=Scleropages formosus TaxID=113540 RepID=A0A0P7ULN7_SCLFO|nr:hypothetical protein Z043_105415 [Scleropages formosus]
MIRRRRGSRAPERLLLLASDTQRLGPSSEACDNCVALESSTVAGIVSADIVATVLIGVAVYFIASQPRGRSYSNSKGPEQDIVDL